MTAAVLTIGTELTRGELVDTNGPWLSERLTDLDLQVMERVTVDDDEGRIIQTLRRLAERVDWIVSTGGLGPTTDDLTSQAVANLLGVPMVRDEASLDAMKRRFERFGRPMSPSNAKQADFPRGSGVLPNSMGTAPGFSVAIGKAQAFFLPGVPREMRPMFESGVLPLLQPKGERTSRQIRLRTFGLPESVVGEKLAGIEANYPGITLGYRAHFPEIEVKVLARATSAEDALRLSEAAASEVRARLHDVVYGGEGDSYGEVVGRALRTRGYRLAIAESCTGGLVGHLLAQNAGASEFLLADTVVYSNVAKETILGIDSDLLRAHGAVSAEAAAAMAEAVKRLTRADVGLAITGVAGPGGGTDDKPVGTVFFGICARGTTRTVDRLFKGFDRLQVQTLAAYAGLKLVREVCEA